VELPPQALLDIGITREEIGTFTCFQGTGCGPVRGQRVRGRIALYEVMPLTEELRELVLNGASAGEINAARSTRG